MDTPEPDDTQGSAVAIVDSLNLRRTGLMAFLTPWAEGLGCSLHPMNGDDLTGAAPCRMFILNLGSRSISDPDHCQWIKAIREQPLQAGIGAAFAHEIAFTSGGTESDNAAILSALEGVAGVGRSHPSSSVLEDRLAR
ncbi:hypothetical protein [Microvirga lotononidis]|uniref:hypothetical protein n=1 Tax=Microvirga lotononidis TaxID=864069 RepID=UPI00058C0A1D